MRVRVWAQEMGLEGKHASTASTKPSNTGQSQNKQQNLGQRGTLSKKGFTNRVAATTQRAYYYRGGERVHLQGKRSMYEEGSQAGQKKSYVGGG